MRQSSILIALVALVGIGSYAVFAQYQQAPQQYQQPPQQYQQPSQQYEQPPQPQQPMGGGMMGGQGMMQGGMGQGMMQGGMGRGMMQGGMGRGMMGGGMGRGMMMRQGAGPMGGPGCPGCGALCGALAQESVTATTDGGVVVAIAGKLIKYDPMLKKVAETDLDVDWSQVHRKMQQIMQNCPMMQRGPGGPPTQPGPTSARSVPESGQS
jgi:hypothetical protein